MIVVLSLFVVEKLGYSLKLSVLSVEAQSGQRLSDAKQVTVTLTLTDDKEDLPIRKQSGVVGLRRHRIQRICQQAIDQGGLLTAEDLAYRIFNCGQGKASSQQ